MRSPEWLGNDAGEEMRRAKSAPPGRFALFRAGLAIVWVVAGES